MVNVHEAKTNFSKLLDRVEAGERIVIARNGRPIAELGPLSRRVAERHLGELKGMLEIAEDFNDPLPVDELDAFER
jgi:prevent-host-death family protein